MVNLPKQLGKAACPYLDPLIHLWTFVQRSIHKSQPRIDRGNWTSLISSLEESSRLRTRGELVTTVTFLGGIDEIGGNCFLVEDKGTRLLLDFGMRFSVRRKYFEEYLKPRSSAGLIDVLTLGLVPDQLESSSQPNGTNNFVRQFLARS